MVSWQGLGSSNRCSNAVSFLEDEPALALIAGEGRSESEAVLGEGEADVVDILLCAQFPPMDGYQSLTN